MASQRISLTGFQKKLLKLAPHLEAATVRGLRAAALRTQGLIVEQIIESAVDRGELAASVVTRNLPDGAIVEVQAPHAEFVDQGTRPHMPPIAPLASWAMRKFGVGEKEANAIAWGVALSIKVNGTDPVHFMQKAFAKAKPMIKREVARALGTMK